ncbi:MAG: hypothetical protein AAFY21_00560, partial [Cyanobacteria bacterium J06641_2]
MTQWQPQPKLMMQKNPSQHILLYQGFTELINDAQIIEGEAVVKISWHPSPNINFKFIKATYLFQVKNHSNANLFRQT